MGKTVKTVVDSWKLVAPNISKQFKATIAAVGALDKLAPEIDLDDEEAVEKFLAMSERIIKNFEDMKGSIKKVLTDAGVPDDQLALVSWLAHIEMVKERLKNTGPIKVFRNAIIKLKDAFKNTAVFKAFRNALDRISNSKFGSWLKAMEQAVKLSIGSIIKLVAALVALVYALVKLSTKAAEVGDTIDKGSQKLNMTAELYEKWSYAMELCGSSIEEMNEGYNQFIGKISGAINGTESNIEAFNELGVSLYDVNGELRNSGQIFEEVIIALKQIENTSERSAMAQKFFGESASKLNTLLNSEADFLDLVTRTQNALNSLMSQTIITTDRQTGAMSNLVSISAQYKDAVTTMKQAWQGFSNAIAAVVLPILTKIIKAIATALAYISTFVRTIFGIKKSVGSDTGSAFDSASNSIGGYTDSLNDASSAAKELKRQTMGFDEMNIMQSESDSGSSSTDTGSSGYGFSGVGDTSGLTSLLPEDTLTKIEAFLTKMDEISSKVQGWVTALLIVIGALLACIGAITLNIPLVIVGLALAGLGIAIGIKSGTFDRWGEAIDGIAATIKAGCKQILTNIGNSLKEAWNKIFTWFSDTDEKLTSWFNGLNAKISNFFNGIVSWIYVNVIQPIGQFFSNLWTGVKQYTQNAIQSIKEFFKGLPAWFNTTIIQPIKNFFNNLWSGVTQIADKAWQSLKTGATNAWLGIKSVFSSVGSFFRETFTKAWENVKNVFSTGGKIFEGIKEGIVSAFKTIVNAIIRGINNVIAVPFNALNTALEKIRTIKIFGAQPFLSLIHTINVPKIPELARGGITTGPTLAKIGEAGREMVLPLENNTEWIDTLVDRFNQKNQTPAKIILQVDGKELGYATINNINQITRQTGSLQLKLA